MDAAVQWVLEHGYPALFGLLALGVLGAPIPDETLLALTGAMVARGELSGPLALASAAGGSMCGITVSYALGRFTGRWLKRGERGWRKRFADRVERGSEWFERHGPTALIGGYFIPGVRHLTAVVAGTSRLPYRTFALYAYARAVLWTLTFLAVGWWAGEEWRRVAETIHRHLRIVKPALVLAAVAYLLWWIRSRRRLESGTRELEE